MNGIAGMSNPLFAQPQQPMPQPPANPLQALMQNPQQATGMLNEFRSNPAMVLARVGFNIPQNLVTPEQIGPYLVQSGQLKQEQVNQMMTMMPQFRQLFSK